MLGRLLHTAATSLNPAAYGRNLYSLESTTEEEHTRSLLFPDASLLQHTSHAYPLQTAPPSPLSPAPGGYDDRGGLELDLQKDFRVIIAQDALGDQDEACVLLDTQASTEPGANAVPSCPNATGKSSPRHHRRGASTYNAQPPNSPTSPQQAIKSPIQSPGGAFFKPRIRSATISVNERDASPGHDARDDTRTILDCMFGSLGNKGTSTKMHILNGDGTSSSPGTQKANISRDPDATLRKENRPRQPLSRAHTYGAQMGPPSAARTRGPNTPDSSKSQNEAVLLTRVFAVNLPEPADADDESVPQTPGVGSNSAYPFPDMTGSSREPSHKRKKLKENKTPTYAIAIVVRLPSASKITSSRPGSRRASHAGAARNSGSLSSSYGSDLPSSWTFLDAFPVPTAKVIADSIDARIDALVEHWDIVSRTLSALQKEASAVILNLLKEKELATRVPAPKTPKVPKEKTMQRTNQRIIQLMPYALYTHKDLQEKALHAASRLCFALRNAKVVTGQNRWSIWQDEARWISRWAGGKEQNFYFYTLLTSFLGIHTDWLGELSNDWYRRRFARQKKSRSQELVASRTVIVCADKMAARRLIFLLSSFLPSLTRTGAITSPVRPTTTSSTHSPPAGHMSRQPSLRRAVNRRAMDSRLATTSPERRGFATSVSSNEGDTLDGGERDPHERLYRANSNTPSIRTARLALPVYESSTRKSSATTTATITPNPTTPVAHFTTITSPSDDYFNSKTRADGSDGGATSNLAGNLKRHDSASASFGSDRASGSGRWGSLLSGIWSNRLESSAETDFTVPSLHNSEGRKQSQSPSRRPKSKLEQMVEEAGKTDRPSSPINATHALQRPLHDDGDGTNSSVMSQSERESTPIKLMVDENDGVVDVEIDAPGFFGSSVDSPLNSPPARSARRTPSLASIDGMASLHSHSSTANFGGSANLENQSNVAGWLRTYHEDFALQAVRPYPELNAHIRASMYAEPTPQPPYLEHVDEQGRKWVDVCTTLVADSRDFKIKRLTLKRQVHGTRPDDHEVTSNGVKSNGTLKKAPKDDKGKEYIKEDWIMDMDTTLIDAVDRVITRSTYPSRTSSPIPGASRSHSRNPSSSTATHNTTTTTLTKDALPPVLEVSRSECRKVITNTLKEIACQVYEELNRRDGGRDIKSSSNNTIKDGKGSLNGARNVLKGSSFSSDKARPKSSKGISEENTLREGIRKWFLAIDQTDSY